MIRSAKGRAFPRCRTEEKHFSANSGGERPVLRDFFRKLGLYVSLCLPLSTAVLRAQYVVLLPGVDNSDPTVSVFESSTLSPVATLSAPNAFALLPLADGSQYFLPSNTNGAAITVLGPDFSVTQQIGAFPDNVNVAALSPDGSWLLAASSMLHVFSTSTSTDLTPNGVAIGQSAAIVGLVVNYDSQTAFVLGTGATPATGTTTSYLSAVGLGENPTVTKTVNLTGAATALALGPNGLLYVGLPNQVLEINPATLAVTPNGTLAMQALPGPIVFTPDGLYALTVNQNATNDTDAAVVLLDLTNHIVAGSVPYATLTAPFSNLFVTSATVVYAYSSSAISLYTVQIGANGGIILSVPPLPAQISNQDVAAVGFSTDLGVPNRTAPQFLFILDSEGDLSRIDPASFTLGQQTVIDSAPTLISYFTPTLNQNFPTTAFTYGDNQTIAAGGTTLPLVIRVLDQNGLPMSGVGVEFSADSGSIVNPDVTTGADGYAEGIYQGGTSPSDMGAISVTATASSVSATFTVNVGTPPNGEVTPSALNIVSGQGQVVFVDAPGGVATGPIAPFTVVALDDSGAPVPNALVTFTGTSGAGSLEGTTGPEQSTQVEADSNGVASVDYVPPLVAWGPPGFETDTITASVGANATQTFYITTMAENSSYCGTPPCSPPATSLHASVLTPAPGAVLTGGAGTTLTGAIQVAVNSTFGSAVPNVGVQVSTGAGTSSATGSTQCANPTGGGAALTNSSGVATCNLLLNGQPGTHPLTIIVPADTYNGQPVSFTGYTLNITVGPPATVTTVSGDNQTGKSGVALPLPFVVQVQDASKNPVPGTAISWKVTSGSMTLVNAPTVTAANGQSSVIGVPASPPGSQITVQVTVGTVSDTFTVYVLDPATAIAIASGNNQTTTINTPFSAPLVVQLTDAGGNPAAYNPVTFSVTSGSASLDTPSVVADQNGTASTTLTAGAAGPLVVKAALTAKISASFNLTVLPAGPINLTILNSASFTTNIAPGTLVTLFGGNLTPTIQGVVTDPNQMAGYSITFGDVDAPILVLVNQNGSEQINAQVPFEASPGDNTVTIQTPQGSTSADVQVSSLAPGIFTNGTVSAFGQTYPLANVVRSDGSYASATNPVQPGETITFYATGLGQTTPAAADGVAGVPGQLVIGPIYAGINHQSTNIVQAIYEPTVYGVYAITVEVPSNTLAGPAQPISLYMVDQSGIGYNAPDAYVPIQ